MSDWQDISTAPKDGTAVWLFVDGQPMIGYGEEATAFRPAQFTAKAGVREREPGIPDEVFGTSYRAEPTHWMHLPAPPHSKEIEG